MERYDYRSQNDVERDELEGERVELDCGTDTVTQQQFSLDADINELVRRFGITGKMPEPVLDPSYYGDVDSISDLRSALDVVRDASQRFGALPAAVRKRFHDDPAELFAFLDDGSNRVEAVKLGLLVERREPEPEAPAPVPIVSESDADS